MQSTAVIALPDRPALHPQRHRSFPAAALLLALLGTPLLGQTAAIPRALPAGQLPQDVRLGPLKDLDGVFPFRVPDSKEEWSRRADRLRRNLQVALGLHPLPSRTPLNPVIQGRIDREDYSVEKVYFESFPGFYVTGSLYRPKNRSGKGPAILSPHGHWADGRFYDTGADGVRKEIAQGAELYPEGGRSPLQARCVGLARLGCVVFHYDMLGYADSVQIPQSVAHGFSKQRPEMNSPENWGLFSPQAESRLQSVMGLQTWNSIRALDFLESLPDVDPSAIGVTGASGGGTQTFILCALDPRPALAFPAVMVSTHMQGGCTCENACGLRIGAGNVDLAALFAPKPLGLTCANDWTLDMATNGFPQLQALYRLLGSPDSVMLHRGEQFGHNYNSPSRRALYSWVNRWFRLDSPNPAEEGDYRRLTRDEMTVWDAQHPKPTGGPDFERRLLAAWSSDTQRHLAEQRRTRRTFEASYGSGIAAVLGRDLADVGATAWTEHSTEERDGARLRTGLLCAPAHGEELPLLRIEPRNASGHVVVWLDPAGKAGLFRNDGNLRPEVTRLLDAGATVVSPDLLFQGEFLQADERLRQTRRVKNPREAAAYTFGYNPSVFAQRTHDVLTVIAHLKSQTPAPRSLTLLGFSGAGPWAAAALAQARSSVRRAAIDTAGFRFADIRDLQDPDFLPGGALYGDLPGMIATGAPRRLWLAGEGADAPDIIREVYARARGAKQVLPFAGASHEAPAAAVTWLLQEWKAR
ncbi:MAG TPA: acetylxylan esterase [Verrucomicrobiota bacterium]|nr:acetylxylan esterase [Verrucomicrobiota bacterium]HNU51209.1 acetylxylan esterase [Verrucomicrobiota bacterium]